LTFEELGLRAELLRALTARGYTVPTPVQAQAIPIVLQGHDLLAGAQTGTGKTAAFALPILHLLSQRESSRGQAPRVLVLTPTRELADQVGASFKTYGKHLSARVAIVYGGVGYNPQVQQLRGGSEIVVATPGRLLDHATQKTIDLSKIEILVLDEADRMLDMGFIHDIKRVMKYLPAKRQTMLFSATYSDEIRALADGLLRNPREVEVARRNTAAELIEQLVHPVPQAQKRSLLSHLILEGDWRQVLVFTRTKHGANRLAKQLNEDGVTATAIHGNKSQSARTRALTDFKKGTMRVLVATDIASRGLDISQLPHVVNYELPNVPEDYVHRIGRTGRAGLEGTAISLVCPEEEADLRAIERLLKRGIERREIRGFASRETASPRPSAARVPTERSRRPEGARPARRTAASPAGRSNGRSAAASAAPARAHRIAKSVTASPYTSTPVATSSAARPSGVTRKVGQRHVTSLPSRQRAKQSGD